MLEGKPKKGGLQMGDVIIECENRKIENADEFVDVLNEEFFAEEKSSSRGFAGKKWNEGSTKYITRSTLTNELLCAAIEVST